MSQLDYSKYPILIYDDDESIMDLLTDILATKFRIIQAKSEEDLVVKYKNNNAAILIIDFHLEKSTGLELVQKLPSHSTRTIMISGDKSRSLLEKAINEEKIVGFITKPFSLSEVRQIITEHYRSYVDEILETMQNVQNKQQAKRYQQEVSQVNETLFETLVTSHSNYRVADRLAGLIDNQVDFVVQRANLDVTDIQIKEMLLEIKTLISSIHTQFSIDSVVILDAIINILVDLMEECRMDQILELEEYIQDNLPSLLEVHQNSAESQFATFLDNLKEDVTKDKFDVISTLEDFSNLRLANTLVSEFLQANELPNPSVHFILIITEDKPIFKWSEVINYDLSLASNFIIALDSFSKEMLRHGEIKTIQLEKAVMMVRQREEITFCCLVDYETLEIRMRFENFISSTIRHVQKNGSYHSLDDDKFVLEKLSHLNIDM